MQAPTDHASHGTPHIRDVHAIRRLKRFTVCLQNPIKRLSAYSGLPTYASIYPANATDFISHSSIYIREHKRGCWFFSILFLLAVARITSTLFTTYIFLIQQNAQIYILHSLFFFFFVTIRIPNQASK